MKSPYDENVRTHQDSTYKKVLRKFNNKHSATHHKIEIEDKVILKRHDKETKPQSKYYKQIYKVTAKNGSVVTLQGINGNELVRNITFVKRVNIPDRKQIRTLLFEKKRRLTPNENAKQFITKTFKRRGIVTIGHYIIHFENILVFILLLFLLIYIVIFERLIQSVLKRVLIMSLCENIMYQISSFKHNSNEF